jgi:hypothetical protein
MLEKHSACVEAKERPGKSPGDQCMKELSVKPSIEYKGIVTPPKPPKIRGYLYKLGKVLGGKNKRFFELNPMEGTLVKYMAKQNCPKNPKELYSVAEIETLTRLPTSGAQKFFFFEVLLKLSHSSYSSASTSSARIPRRPQTSGCSTSLVRSLIASL